MSFSSRGTLLDVLEVPQASPVKSRSGYLIGTAQKMRILWSLATALEAKSAHIYNLLLASTPLSQNINKSEHELPSVAGNLNLF